MTIRLIQKLKLATTKLLKYHLNMLSVGLYLINYLVTLLLKNLKYFVTDIKNRL